MYIHNKEIAAEKGHGVKKKQIKIFYWLKHVLRIKFEEHTFQVMFTWHKKYDAC